MELPSIISSFVCGNAIFCRVEVANAPLNVSMGLLAIIILLIGSGLISASEAAFFGLSASQIEKIKNSSENYFRRASYLLENPDFLLATILIANNFINVGIVLISVYVTNLIVSVEDYPLATFIIQSVVVTFIILFFGEISPKIYSTHKKESIIRLMATPLFVLEKLFKPINFVLVKSTGIVDRRLKKREDDISLKDISEAINITKTSSDKHDEARMFKGIVNFGNIQVREIMVPRVDAVAVNDNTPYDELLQIIRQSGYSRIPVYSGSPDSVVGILYIKDLLKHLNEGKDYPWQRHLRPAYYIPENKKIDTLLTEFQSQKIHIAIVVDEYGGTSGIVTLEDILEEIFGDISDEFDEEEDEKNYVKVDENTYIFDGKILLNDFCRILQIREDIFDEVSGEFDTLAGLILELEGRLPATNEVIFYKNFEFRIESADYKRIKGVRVTYHYDEEEDKKK